MRLTLEGWRGISHSYALIHQYQLLELKRRQGITVFHRDRPFPDPRWSRLAGTSGFDPCEAAMLADIPSPDGPANITFRICYPHDASADGGARVFTFATCEFDRLIPGAISAVDQDSLFVTPSRWSKQGLVASGLDPRRIHIVPHGIDPAIFHPPSAQSRAAMRRWLGIGPQQFLFLNVSAVTANKGIDALLIAFTQVHARHPQAILLLKDQSTLYENFTAAGLLESMANVMGPARHAVRTLSDDLSLTALAGLYGAADAYISPYRAEGFNLPPLEAAACGVPIAVTAGGATDDYAQDSFALKIASRPRIHDGLGMLEPEQDAIVEAMLRLIEQPKRDMTSGVRWIAENYSWTRAVDKLLAAFAA
jgi:glycosyltransferase involved in cell wall biosynthesis